MSVIFDVVANVQPHAQAGTLKVLAAAGDHAPSQFPQVPLVKNTVPGLTMNGWVGLFAPAGTPAPIVQQLNAAVRAALSEADLNRRLSELGFEVTPGTARQLEDTARRDSAMYAHVIEAAGLRTE